MRALAGVSRVVGVQAAGVVRAMKTERNYINFTIGDATVTRDNPFRNIDSAAKWKRKVGSKALYLA